MNSLRDLCGRVMSGQDLSDAATDCRVLRIAFSSPERVCSRRVVTRSRFRPTGKYPSWKMERMLQWESMNELNAFRLLDCDPRGTAFSEQPYEIVYFDGTEFVLAKSLGAVDGMTQSGEMLGTPRYMAPEQVEAKHVDARTDIYAALIFYEILTADVPFSAESIRKRVTATLRSARRSPAFRCRA
jgi:serine/threonine protein kinase